MGTFAAKRIANGTWGEFWLDDDLIAEVYKCQLKSSMTKDEIKLCGQMEVDTKITGVKNTGSVGMYHVNSRLIRKYYARIAAGEDVRGKIVTNLDDPDAFGSDRICCTDVSFDDLTLADWEAGVYGKIEAPFTFVKAIPLELMGE